MHANLNGSEGMTFTSVGTLIYGPKMAGVKGFSPPWKVLGAATPLTGSDEWLWLQSIYSKSQKMNMLTWIVVTYDRWLNFSETIVLKLSNRFWVVVFDINFNKFGWSICVCSWWPYTEHSVSIIQNIICVIQSKYKSRNIDFQKWFSHTILTINTSLYSF